MSDQEFDTLDTTEVEEEDNHIELEAAAYDDANGDNSEQFEVDELDEEMETKERTPSPEKSDRKRSRSRSADKSRSADRSRSIERKDDEKEDFNDSELDSDVDDTETTEDAEAEEKELLNMPSLKNVMADVGHLKTERRVMVHSLSWDEVNHPSLVQTVLKDSCEEIKLNFVRPKDNPQAWSGIAILHFTSSRAAKDAVEELKSIREDINVKSDDETAYPRAFVENWIKAEKGQKRWTETLLLIKNIGEDVTEDQLKEIFSDAEDIVFAKQHDYRRKEDKKTKMAYAVYRTGDAALAAAKEYVGSSIELGENILKVYKYHVPVDNLPRGLLKLHERRVVLKYFEKLSEQVDTASEEHKAPEWCTKRHKTCASIIEQDNKCRENLGLPTPSLDDLRANRGVKIIRGSKRKDLLIRLGVIPQKRRSYAYDNRGSSDKKRSYGSSSSSRSLLGNPPSLLNLNMRAIPMQYMMQQSGMGYMGGMGSEPSNKMLRLDASGNFHVDYDRDRQRRRDDKDGRSRSSRSGGGSSRYDRR